MGYNANNVPAWPMQRTIVAALQNGGFTPGLELRQAVGGIVWAIRNGCIIGMRANPGEQDTFAIVFPSVSADGVTSVRAHPQLDNIPLYDAVSFIRTSTRGKCQASRLYTLCYATYSQAIYADGVLLHAGGLDTIGTGMEIALAASGHRVETVEFDQHWLDAEEDAMPDALSDLPLEAITLKVPA